MRFFYTATPMLLPDEDDALLLLRPEIPLRIVGSTRDHVYQALVDTGADHTIFPAEIADELGIELGDAVDDLLLAYGGQQLDPRPGVVGFQLEDPMQHERPIVWEDEVLFLDGVDESIILGHSSFLNYFTATFDGKLAILELTANDTLPGSSLN